MVTGRDTIDVGCTTQGPHKIFIAVPDSAYEPVESCLRGHKKHAIVFDRDTARWLIEALERELSGETDA